MCGIYGAVNFKKNCIDLGQMNAISSKISRRGPDDEGQYQPSDSVFLGHRRLSIIDLSQASHQPMVDKALNLSIVFNGTIYNYPSLRKKLMGYGYEFFSKGDTEVIIKAYHKWGQACVEHLHGMFAFAIWDESEQLLFIARDRMGIKPLYFAKTDETFYFASSAMALVATGVCDTSLNPQALHNQLSLHAVVPAPNTIFNGIHKFRPAYLMTVTQAGEITERRYWDLIAKRSAETKSAEQWQEEIEQALLNAVKTRVEVSDVPVGVLLSGGLDSSLIVALLAKAGVEDFKTFSIGFEDIGDEKGSEFEFSDAVVERYKTDHQKIIVPNTEVLKRLPEAVANMSEPMVGQDSVAFYLLAEQVSKSVKVVLSGQGADEVFAGYFWYPRMEEESGDFQQRFSKHYIDRSHDEYLQMMSPKYASDDVTSAFIKKELNTEHADTFMDAVLRMDVTNLIVDDPVKRVDNMTMAWGLESRVPFLDQKLVELAFQMPPELKLQHGGKGILKQIARGLIPDAVIDRPKGYFPMPALKYVRGEFYEFMSDVLMSQKSRERGLFSGKYIDMLLKEPEQHFTKLNGSKLWHCALLEYWL
nr:N-acetylglutaminylglutamine amidotransferase [Bacteroidota bacterium]